eukprot:795766-Alexandrium_andersonii.AAC.1
MATARKLRRGEARTCKTASSVRSLICAAPKHDLKTGPPKLPTGCVLRPFERRVPWRRREPPP